MVQGADLRNENRWIPLIDALNSEKGETMKIFQDGSGCLSRKAVEICIQRHEDYYSNWHPSTNLEAYNMIRNLNIPIYEITHKKAPLVAVQLYIPGWSVITWSTEEELVNATQAVRLSNKLSCEIANHTLSIDTIRELRRSYGLHCKLNDVILQACPITRQFYKTVSIADLYIVVAIRDGDYTFIQNYFHTKCTEEPLNEYYAYAFVLSCYSGNEHAVPYGINSYFTPTVISRVNSDFHNGFSRLLFLDYCKCCPRYGKENCISENKIRLFSYMTGEANEETNF